ncbi:acyl-CoA N-acyltransferase [Aspergillus bertholletiae]|uniref:Acyl-CoA N-acyltransferase n=1 Tax=Aspergillus bertholletiae TaxID=1226010 RepID=A0A5N7B3L5_9EURO|nr:acyl-CoA N-acyltransferase [Aspergillus bertholletiae]
MTDTTPETTTAAAAAEKAPYILRTHRPGDMGWIIHRHGALYHAEYGWNERFEALVARITADFIDHYDPKTERCWIAERKDGAFLGCVMLVKDREENSESKEPGEGTENVAKLRLLLVEPSARGLGLGRALIRQCTTFARDVGYSRIRLWTNSVLASARYLYGDEGYRLVNAEEHELLGFKLTGENWELVL